MSNILPQPRLDMEPQTTASRSRFNARGAVKLHNPKEDNLFLNPPKKMYYDRSSGVAVRKIDGRNLPRMDPPKKAAAEAPEELRYLRGNAPALARLLVQLHMRDGASIEAVVEAARALADKAAELLTNPRVVALLTQEQTAKAAHHGASATSEVDAIKQSRADTLVGHAIKGDLEEVVRKIESGQTDSLDTFHSTLLYNALMGASHFGHLDVVQELLMRGADANLKDYNHGNTALHYAAQAGRCDVLSFLKKAGARIPVHNLRDEKPSDLARESHKARAVKLLREVSEPPTELHVAAVGARTATFAWTMPVLNIDNPPLDRVEFKFRAVAPGTAAWPHPDDEEDEQRPLGNGGQWFSAVYEAEPPFQLHALRPASWYAVAVRLHNEADYSDSTADEPGWSEFSNVAVIHTMDAPPSAPGPPTMFSTTSASVTIDWTPPKRENGTPVMQYDIHFAISPADHLHEDAQEYVNLKKLEWTKVHQKIYVAHSEGEMDAQAGGAAAVDASGHKVVTGSKGGEAMVMLPPGYCRYTCFNMQPYTYYFFRVRALNDDGWGEWSRVGEPILATDALGFTELTPRAVLLHWQEPKECTVLAYELQQRLADAVETGPWAKVCNTIPVDFGNFPIEDLEPYTDYQWRVRVLEPGTGWRAWGTAMSSRVVRTLACEPAPPGQPRALSVFYNAISVEWAPAVNHGAWVNLYEVKVKGADAADWELEQQVEPDPTGAVQMPLCKFARLEPKTRYIFVVRAHNKLGWSAPSAVSDAIQTRATLPPGVPQLLSQGASYIELYWDPPDDSGVELKYYEMQAKEVPIGLGVRGAVGVAKGSGEKKEKWFAVPCKTREPRGLATDLRPHAGYRFRVRAFTSEGWSNFCDASDVYETTRRA